MRMEGHLGATGCIPRNFVVNDIIAKALLKDILCHVIDITAESRVCPRSTA